MSDIPQPPSFSLVFGQWSWQMNLDPFLVMILWHSFIPNILIGYICVPVKCRKGWSPAEYPSGTSTLPAAPSLGENKHLIQPESSARLEYEISADCPQWPLREPEPGLFELNSIKSSLTSAGGRSFAYALNFFSLLAPACIVFLT